MELTCVRLDGKAGRHAVSVHDAVLDLSVDAHVGILGLDPQDERPGWLVLQDHGVLAVVLTLRGHMTGTEVSLPSCGVAPPPHVCSARAQSPPGTPACCC